MKKILKRHPGDYLDVKYFVQYADTLTLDQIKEQIELHQKVFERSFLNRWVLVRIDILKLYERLLMSKIPDFICCNDCDTKYFEQYVDTLSLEKIREELIEHKKIIENINFNENFSFDWVLIRIEILKKYDRLLIPSQEYWGI